ncbi:MAG: hypothetical protein Q7S56_00670 [Nanoarchaeota archaeon]|nr:hypothetical protein [Nanoarchaeota archaeon]
MGNDRLETKTVMNFIDGDEEVSVVYDTLLDFREGVTINLVFNPCAVKIRRGDYILKLHDIPNQLTLCLDENPVRPDSLYRRYDCYRIEPTR